MTTRSTDCDLPPARGCRDLLLDSAEEVILRTGLGSLTLDAVAAEARVSKGGLLYHFRSKDALILALVERTCEHWKADYLAAIAEEPEGPGRVSRALLRMCMGSPESCSETCRRSSVVMVAAIANNPALAAPLKKTHNNLRDLLKGDGAPEAVGEIVLLALNGLWFDQVFGLSEMPAARVNAIRSEFERMVAAAVARGNAPATPARPTRRRTGKPARTPAKGPAATTRTKTKRGNRP